MSTKKEDGEFIEIVPLQQNITSCKAQDNSDKPLNQNGEYKKIFIKLFKYIALIISIIVICSRFDSLFPSKKKVIINK